MHLRVFSDYNEKNSYLSLMDLKIDSRSIGPEYDRRFPVPSFRVQDLGDAVSFAKFFMMVDNHRNHEIAKKNPDPRKFEHCCINAITTHVDRAPTRCHKD